MSAVISPDGAYRYELRRIVGLDPTPMTFLMLNPSTADATLDDPTIRRCMAFARREGHGSLTVLNLYAFRTTQPSALWSTPDPVGSDNDRIIKAHFDLARRSQLPVVAAWGVNAKPERVNDVLALAEGIDLRCLGTTKDGHPRHPLYVRGDQRLLPWPPQAVAA